MAQCSAVCTRLGSPLSTSSAQQHNVNHDECGRGALQQRHVCGLGILPSAQQRNAHNTSSSRPNDRRCCYRRGRLKCRSPADGASVDGWTIQHSAVQGAYTLHATFAPWSAIAMHTASDLAGCYVVQQNRSSSTAARSPVRACQVDGIVAP